MVKKNKFITKVIKFITLRSLIAKVLLTFIVIGTILFSFTNFLLRDSINEIGYKLILEREKTDLNYLEDLIKKRISFDEFYNWDIIDGKLCYGSIVIGDGTEENAFLEPFLETEEKTGTFCYSFMKTSDNGLYNEGLGWTGDEITGYQQGHYIRVAGSTKGPDGEEIIGTYIDKKVADVLDEHGEYAGTANVEGGLIYCYYKNVENKDNEVVGCIVVGRSLNDIENKLIAVKNQTSKLTIIITLIAILLLMGIISRWLFSISKINNHLKIIEKGYLPNEDLKVNTRDEIGEMTLNINNMVTSLREKERIGAELNVATNIQANMLPSIFPAFPECEELDIYASMKPAREVGGDFYDFFKIDNENIAVVMADVSGKGVPAALFMVIAKTLIKNYTQMGLPPEEVFTKVNEILLESNDAGMFVTAWLGVINIKTGVLTYVNAGHNPPLIKIGDSNFEYLYSKASLVLAGMEGIKYKQNALQMKKSDKLFLYTDGVTEATNMRNELYGELRLNMYLNTTFKMSAEETLKGVKKSLDEFVGNTEQFDDITMLMLEYQKDIL